MGATVIRLDRQHLVVRHQRLVDFLFRAQDVGLEQPRVGTGCIGRDGFFRQCRGSARIVARIRQARHADQRQRMVCLGQQRRLIGLACRIGLLQTQVGVAAHAEQVGRLAVHCRSGYIEHLLELALGQQRLGQYRHGALARDAQAAGLANFLVRRNDVAGVEVNAGQHQARFAILRVLGHRILELDDGSLVIALGVELLGIGEQRLG